MSRNGSFDRKKWLEYGTEGPLLYNTKIINPYPANVENRVS
jgi:hypothetical protein